MMSSNELLDFLNSGFFLFLLGSVLVPVFLRFYLNRKEQVDARRIRDLSIRVLFYRCLMIKDFCDAGTRDGMEKALDVLHGRGSYISVLPEIEKDVPLAGLVLKLLPQWQLRVGRNALMPPSVRTIRVLEDLLGEIAGKRAEGFAVRYYQNEEKLKQAVLEVMADLVVVMGLLKIPEIEVREATPKEKTPE